MYQNLGIQLYTVRDYMNDPEFAELTFCKLAGMGYTEVQTAGNAFDEKLFGKLLTKYGLSVIGTHYSFKELLESPEKIMEQNRIWGSVNIGLGCLPMEPRQNLSELKKFIHDFNALAEIYAKHGFRLTYHNHHFEFLRINGYQTMMDLLYEELDPDTVSFVLDTCWVAAGGGDVTEWMEKMQGRLDILHLKDLCLKTNKKTGALEATVTEIGHGNLSWQKILSTAQKIGVKHYIVEQDYNFLESPFDSLKASADYLKRFLHT